MRSTKDPITGLKQKLLDWSVASQEQLKTIDKQARTHIAEEVAIAEEPPVPEATSIVLFEDVYVRGSEPIFLRGRVPEENFYYTRHGACLRKLAESSEHPDMCIIIEFATLHLAIEKSAASIKLDVVDYLISASVLRFSSYHSLQSIESTLDVQTFRESVRESDALLAPRNFDL